jgi:hypothetical protein
MASAIFRLFLVSLISGCATLGPQTQAFLSEPLTIPESKKITAAPFIEQTENYCGPATLAMAMSSAGRSVPVEVLGQEMITPGKKGTLQEDMLGASRRHGFLAVRIRGIPALLGEIAAGNPVVVFQNLGLSWIPRWHYALAVGYDLKREKLILHSGKKAFDEMDLRRFEHSWSLGNHWAIVVLEASKLPATASDLDVVAGAAGLEQVDRSSDAETVYKNVLLKWPHSLGALIGLGNVRYTLKDYSGAVKYLSQAAEFHSDSAMVWHNLATAQGAAHQRQAARKSAQQALRLADPSEAATYRQNLAEWLANP